MIIEINKEDLNKYNIPFQDVDLNSEFESNPFAKALLLLEDNKVIGYIYYSDIYDRVEINQIEVDEIKRNKGKGSQMIQYLIDTVKKDITLEVKEDNIPAIKLYEKYGFKKKAIRKGYYQGIDGLLMERKEDSH